METLRAESDLVVAEPPVGEAEPGHRVALVPAREVRGSRAG